MSFQRFGVTFFLMTQNNKRLRFAVDGHTARHRPANSAAARRLRSVPRLAPKLSPRGEERPPMTSPPRLIRLDGHGGCGVVIERTGLILFDPPAAVVPSAEAVLHRAEEREVLGQEAPGAAARRKRDRIAGS